MKNAMIIYAIYHGKQQKGWYWSHLGLIVEPGLKKGRRE